MEAYTEEELEEYKRQVEKDDLQHNVDKDEKIAQEVRETGGM